MLPISHCEIHVVLKRAKAAGAVIIACGESQEHHSGAHPREIGQVTKKTKPSALPQPG
jgi:hypothetical protein